MVRPTGNNRAKLWIRYSARSFVKHPVAILYISTVPRLEPFRKDYMYGVNPKHYVGLTFIILGVIAVVSIEYILFIYSRALFALRV